MKGFSEQNHQGNKSTNNKLGKYTTVIVLQKYIAIIQNLRAPNSTFSR